MKLDESPDPHTPPAGKAMIIFVRSSGGGGVANYTLLDGKGNFVGELPAKGHTKYVTDAGHRTFIVWAENTTMVEADIAADKTYYVRSARAHGLVVRP